jgi:uncharacterized protein YndB with AHSA1/START domain
MTERSVTHSTFAIERTYEASPARVFSAWADPTIKQRWFAAPEEWGTDRHALDFRVGGHEVNRGGPPGGPVYTFHALYQDIVPDQRIVYTYDMTAGETRLSVSVATIEFRPAGTGTQLILTEQGVFLDGLDQPEYREQGTQQLLDALETELQRQPATT